MRLPKSNTGAVMGGGMTVVLVYVLQEMAKEAGAGTLPVPPEAVPFVPLLGALVAGLLAMLTPYVQTGGK